MKVFKKKKRASSCTDKILESGYLSKPNHVTWKKSQEQGIILDMKRAVYYTVEGVSLCIWELIDKGISFSELVSAICDEYGEGKDVVESDSKELLDSMKKEGIIEIQNEEVIHARKK